MSAPPPPPPSRASGDVAIVGYALAHFGKSLWWNASELFLAFYLTEHLALGAVAAGGAIAAGLLVGAALDLAVARRRHWFASVSRAGRLQACGALGSLLALLVLIAASSATGGMRLGAVVGANLVFRVAYVFYDLPQNCLLSLIDWPRDRQRKVAAWRSAAGAAALIVVSTMVSVYGADATRGRGAASLVATAAAIALGSALWLWRATRGRPDPRRRTRPIAAVSLGPMLALMAIVCLTVPTFSKFTPYLAAYSTQGAPIPLLIVIGACTAGSQPFWLALLRRHGEWRSARIAGILLVAAAAAAAGGAVGAAAVVVGVASGGLATAIWAGFAAQVADADPLAAAPAFARLTATAKIALALAALAIGAILEGVDYRADAMRLLPVLAALTLAGGIGVIASTGRRCAE